jgi:putative membrane protein
MTLKPAAGIAALMLALAASPGFAPAADTTKTGQASKPKLSKDDLRHFDRLARGNLAEVESGKLAQGKAVSGEVKSFAARMVQDHGKMLEELRSMAGAKSIAMPTTPDKEHANVMTRLQSQSGATFDRSYMTQMVKDHEDTLKLVKDIADKAKDSDLKAVGQKAIPQIQEHLDMAKRTASNTQLPDKVQQNAPPK